MRTPLRYLISLAAAGAAAAVAAAPTAAADPDNSTLPQLHQRWRRPRHGHSDNRMRDPGQRSTRCHGPRRTRVPVPMG